MFVGAVGVSNKLSVKSIKSKWHGVKNTGYFNRSNSTSLKELISFLNDMWGISEQTHQRALWDVIRLLSFWRCSADHVGGLIQIGSSPTCSRRLPPRCRVPAVSHSTAHPARERRRHLSARRLPQHASNTDILLIVKHRQKKKDLLVNFYCYILSSVFDFPASSHITWICFLHRKG